MIEGEDRSSCSSHVLSTRKSCELTRSLVVCLQQVVRVQYHPGAQKPSGGWLLEPALKMEFLGRMGTEATQEGAMETDSATDGTPQNEAVAAEE